MTKCTIRILGLLCLLISFSCEQEAPEEKIVLAEEKGIDVLLKNLEAMKTQTVTPFQEVRSSYQELSQAGNELAQTNEEIRLDLISEVKQLDQEAFKAELETVFDVGQEKLFFQRQIDYARYKIDLAVVGIGIIRVHQVLRGENPSVKPKDTQEFIRYIKEQVQNAVISTDKNYKAIVFKGIESSA